MTASPVATNMPPRCGNLCARRKTVSPRHHTSQVGMKKPGREIFVIILIIVIVVLFKVVLVLVNAHLNPATATDTANLPVQSGNVTITISNMEYHPDRIVVTAGTKITWVNHDPMAHTVTEGQHASPVPHGFDSKLIAPGHSWSYVFKISGTYMYTCELHPGMDASVIVR
jgi:plastocyanin